MFTYLFLCKLSVLFFLCILGMFACTDSLILKLFNKSCYSSDVLFNVMLHVCSTSLSVIKVIILSVIVICIAHMHMCIRYHAAALELVVHNRSIH